MSSMLRFVQEQRLSSGQLARREWLRLGGLGLLSLAAKSASGEQVAERPPGFGKAKSVILVFCNGGQRPLGNWGPQPHTPPAGRGVFPPVSAAVPRLPIWPDTVPHTPGG